MLTASLPPRSTWYQKPQRRGRSRNVSNVALARQASEERRRQRAMEQSMPPPPSSTDDYTRPPSPARTLEDRMQEAYARENMVLAKTMYLQLKYNIEVTSSTDPRLDTVRDEDFDEYFLPCGGLKLEEADVKMIEEEKKRQAKMWEEEQRLERLTACERIWEKEKRKMREERKAVLLKREEDIARRKEEEQRKQRRVPRSRAKIFTDHEPGPSKRHPEERRFEYAFMPSTGTTPPSRLPASSSLPKTTVLSSPPSCVSFKDVVSSMHGPLFPKEASEKRRSGLSHSSLSSSTRRTPGQCELFDSLIRVNECDQEERISAKGKSTVRITKSKNCAACSAACAPAPSVASSRSSTALSRTSSWLSFASRTSASTAATTPATSPITSWLKSAPPSLSEKVAVKYVVRQLRHSCTSSGLVQITLGDSPLHKASRLCVEDSVSCSSDTLTTDANDTKPGLGRRVSLGVSSLFELAKGFQSAYVNVTMTMTAEAYRTDSRSQSPSSSPSHSPIRPKEKHSPRVRSLDVPGYRVHAKDVKIFTTLTVETSNFDACQYIPLISPFPPVPLLTPVSTRILSPTPLRFPSPAPLQSSPFRPRSPPPTVIPRQRLVSNPVVLRLRALQNVLVERGTAWEGRGREGGLGCGRERVFGIAIDGRGRSGLGCEVRVCAVV